MKDWLIPSHKNNHKAYLLRWPLSGIWLGLLCLVNVIPVNAVSQTTISGQQLLLSHNQVRQANQLPELTYNFALASSAQQKAQEMLNADCWSHYCPVGKSPWEFFIANGYNYIFAGENLAEGFNSSQEVMDAWMNSPTHKENILRKEYTEVGFGIVEGNFQGNKNNVLIVAHFGTPASKGSTTSSLPTPQIIQPLNGSFTNNPQVTISGSAPLASVVNLYSNQNLVASLPVQQQTFNYEFTANQGIYTVYAQSVANNQTSGQSNPVSFTVDTTPEAIILNELSISNYVPKQTETLISFTNVNLTALSVSQNNTQFKTTKTENGNWEITFPNILNNTQDVVVKTTDLAGNQWEGTISASALQTLLSSFNSIPAKSSINSTAFILLLGLFLIVLLAIDTYYFYASGLTGRGANASVWQLGLAVALVIFIISGSMFGNIGVGIGL